VHGAYGAWCMVHGAWCMAHGAWCITRVRSAVYGTYSECAVQYVKAPYLNAFDHHQRSCRVGFAKESISIGTCPAPAADPCLPSASDGVRGTRSRRPPPAPSCSCPAATTSGGATAASGAKAQEVVQRDNLHRPERWAEGARIRASCGARWVCWLGGVMHERV
jgi:hypothetical protein